MNDETQPTPRKIRQALETLQLPSLVTKADIKRQYRYLSKKHHPDTGGRMEDMARLNTAYETLMKYIENFRYSFDDEEINKQLPGASHAERFGP